MKTTVNSPICVIKPTEPPVPEEARIYKQTSRTEAEKTLAETTRLKRKQKLVPHVWMCTLLIFWDKILA